MSTPHHLVRHGEYGYLTFDEDLGLTEAGQRTAELAGRELLAKQLGQEALILSSDATRAHQTAEILSTTLGEPYTLSHRINIGGNNPEVIEDLDNYLKEALIDQGTDPTSISSLEVMAQLHF